MHSFSNFLGQHTLVELYDCDSERLNDVDFLKSQMLKAALLARATVVEHVEHKFSPHGVTAIVVVEESHLALHTWPENNYAALDIFTCSPQMKAEKAIEHLSDALKAKSTASQIMKRGAEALIASSNEPLQ